MCGIAGVIGRQDEEFGLRMARRLQHRGPDAEKVWCARSVTLAHTRLAIVGLGSEGSQPFFSSDASIVCVYNGEIYNHQELRQRFGLVAGPTDGAILPELWQRFGADSLGMLRGMFSVAVHELTTGRTWLAVDPIGMKTLYVTTSEENCHFASEAMPLARELGLPPEEQVWSEFRMWGRLPIDQSGLMGLARLAPGTVIQFDPAGRVVNRSTISLGYWQRYPRSWSDAAGAFVESVEAHLMADVPTALLLSSGVDSGAIAWAAAELGRTLDCVTLGFEGGTEDPRLAADVAARFGHRHSIVDAAEAVSQYAPDFMDRIDRPTVDGFNTYIACRTLGDRGVKVALSGAGGDELLLGYPYYERRGLPSSAERPIRGLAQQAIRRSGGDRQVRPRFDRVTQVITGVARGALSNDAVTRVRAHRAHRPPVAPRQLADSGSGPFGLRVHPGEVANQLSTADWSEYLAPMLLADSDVFSMAASVEMRLPFLDLPFVTSVIDIPNRSLGKERFVHAIGDPVLSACFRRTKTGFGVPFWMAIPAFRARRDTPWEASTGGILQDQQHARLDQWRAAVFASWLSKVARGSSRSNLQQPPAPGKAAAWGRAR